MENLNYQQIIFILLVLWAIVYVISAFFFAFRWEDQRQREIIKMFCFFWPLTIIALIFYGVWLIAVKATNFLLSWVEKKI